MNLFRRAGTTLALTTAAVLVTAGTAAADYATRYDGPYGSESGCNAASQALDSPPDYYTYPCSYYTGDPTPIRGRGPGWYYRVRYNRA